MSLFDKPCPRCKGAGNVKNLLLPGRHACRRCDGHGRVHTLIGRLQLEIERRLRQALEEKFGLDEEMEEL